MHIGVHSMQKKLLGLAGIALLAFAFVPGGATGYMGGVFFFGGLAVLILAWLGPGSLDGGLRQTVPVTARKSDDWLR
jgi:hypothetical protein